jgi:hypothetical protein
MQRQCFEQLLAILVVTNWKPVLLIGVVETKACQFRTNSNDTFFLGFTLDSKYRGPRVALSRILIAIGISCDGKLNFRLYLKRVRRLTTIYKYKHPVFHFQKLMQLSERANRPMMSSLMKLLRFFCGYDGTQRIQARVLI